MHKASVRKRIIDRFGAYFSHLISMTEDVKSADKQKMKGYTSSIALLCLLLWHTSTISDPVQGASRRPGMCSAEDSLDRLVRIRASSIRVGWGKNIPSRLG